MYSLTTHAHAPPSSGKATNNDEAIWVHLLSGAIAGIIEHCGMYPLDTVKTHLQAQRNGRDTMIGTIRKIYKGSGIRGMFRGISAIAVGAGPAHAIYFGVYELFKHQLTIKSDNDILSQGIAGGLASVCFKKKKVQ
eukprot:TRINITY_DN1329_c0_g1_i10.p1 TRINITY_DN1329_c0_g1~~TRINITY_DN1329_c0_g1_i10.p1  ORF type:complete len:136 (-),score=17.59 TRINITY_DN1329_c0_g1_i10:73-480(-)